MSKTMKNRKAAKLMESGKNVLEFAATKTFQVLQNESSERNDKIIISMVLPAHCHCQCIEIE